MKKNLTRKDFLRYSGAGLGTFGLLALTGCGSSSSSESTSSSSEEETATTEETTGEAAGEVVSEDGTYVNGYEVAPTKTILNSYTYGTDYISLYEQFGSDVTVDEVYEDPDTGYAYIERDGMYYELGLDFLSWAMVYNDDVPEGGIWESADDVYATWWKLYIQRWNALLPEVPLYSNEYYDLYNTQITGVEEHQTNPFWNVCRALIDWGSEKDDNSIIVGSSTELSGAFRYYTYASSSGNASNGNIDTMTRGHYLVDQTKEGAYQWDDTVVASHDEVVNDDGSKTFTVTINDDLYFSDGSPITAKNYIVRLLVFSSPVATNATGVDKRLAQNYVGYDTFAAYDGTNEGADATKELSGISLIDDYTFSITVAAEYIPYFYDITYVRLAPEYLPMWIGESDVVDDGDGVYLTDDFYEKDGDNYVAAAQILTACNNTDMTYPYSGPFCVESFDVGDSSAVLVKNEYYKGNYEGTIPAIEKVVYKRVISSTQLEDLRSGGIDVISGITGGDATNEAIALADGSDGAYAYVHYSRSGYGKLAFRCDYGPVQFVEVRQAIAYCMDRASFAKDFTGGYGGVVDGPYYSGAWMYTAAVEQGMLLDSYSASVDSAIAKLEEGGWIYDKDGNEYTSGIRYKAIPADEINENDKVYQSKDGAYVTSQIGDYYYMPLALNWYGTTDNEFSDLLITGFMEADNIAAAGFAVQNTLGDFNPMLDELYQDAVYGYYAGTPMYCVFNYATSFGVTYDYSYNLTIDPDLYDLYSSYYIKDEADAYWL